MAPDFIKIYEGHPECKERLRKQSTHLFCCSRSLVSGVQCDVEKLPRAVVRRILSHGKCRDSCGHGRADWESRPLWGARCYSFSASQWDLRLSCRRGKLSRGIVLLHDNARPQTAWQIQALLREQFHWDIFEHPPYSTDLVPSDFFLFPKLKEHLTCKRFANYKDLKDTDWITRRPCGMKRLYTNWCQGTTSALMSKETMWKGRQRYVPKLVYRVSVLLLKNILVWQNVL